MVLLLSGLFLGCQAPASAPTGPPNIVLIYADDLGYGDLSSYGHPTIHTPRLDQMARDGLKLSSFYVASSVCGPSRASLLTGRYPIRNGMPGNLGPDSPGGIPQSEILLPEALKTQGYRTALFGKWHLGAVEGYFPTQHGFDEYFGILYSNDMEPPWVADTQRPLHLYRGTEPTDEYPIDQTTLTQRYTEEAIRFIREAKDGPFFLYLPHAMPHLPVSTSGSFVGQSAGGRYGDVIETLDWSTGQILDALQAEGLAENTIVIFTSDNGPWNQMPPRMYETELVELWDAGTAGSLRGSKASTWEGGHRVPCIIRWPGRIPENQVRADIASNLDLYTTLLNLAGAEVPQDRPVDGLDLMSFFEGQTASPRTDFFYLWIERLDGVRVDDWKLHVLYEDGQPPKPELYNLAVDPYERFDVAADHPEVIEQLWGRMTAFAEETGAQLDVSIPVIPERLRP